MLSNRILTLAPVKLETSAASVLFSDPQQLSRPMI